ncbi:LuxR family transcriptional regulator [Crossiella sp. SN42]|uniref:helix-turn-helix transcriptional regulator n=1 Tax=Crossiella sp. SN42 TaxID=2944808 RepID=UPI00207C95A7|nr:AAA family ATPase [Crossiella sp. SN42]MCO1579132.1 LuxR family transcriptional regulator [Crossiella sp. SN42]
MELVGRERELELLNDAVRSAGGMLDGTFVVTGPGGAGKTALLSAFARGLDEGLVLFAAGSRAERDIGLGVLRQLMAHPRLPPAAAQLVDRMAGVDRLAPDGATSVRGRPRSTVHRSDALLLDELCRVLTVESERHRVVIMIDDVHEADKLSLTALAYLQRRFRLSRVVFVLAQPFLPAGSVDVDGQLPGKRLVLSPMSPAAVGTLVAAELGGAWAAEHAAEVHEITGGNPGLVTAVIDDQLAVHCAHSPTDRVAPGPMFAQAYLTYLHRLGAPTVAIAYRLALLDEQLTSATSATALLVAVMPSRADQIACAVNELESAGLLHGGRFRHPAVRAAVERSTRKRSTEADAPGTVTGLHLVRPDAELVNAGVEAVDWSQPRWLLDDTPAELALLDRPRDGEAGGRHPEREATDCAATGKRAAQSRHRLRPNVRGTAAGSAVASPDADGESAALAPARPGLDTDDATSEVTRDRSAPPVGTPGSRHDDPSPRTAAGLSSRVVALSLHAADPSSDATGGLSPRDEPFAQFVPLAHRYADGQVARSRLSPSEVASRRALAGETGRLVWQAEAKRRRGELREAVQMVETALRMLPAGEWGPALAGPLSVAVTANTAMGRLDSAEHLLRAAMSESLLDTHFGLRLLWSLGQYQIARRRPGEALDTFFRCAQTMVGRGLDRPALAPWRTSAAEAQFMLGNERVARSLAALELERAGREAPRTRGRALRVLASTCRPRDRLGLLKESVQLLSGSGDRVEVAHSLRELSRAHKLVGAAREAHSAAARAFDLARACGLQPLVEDPLLVELIGPLGQPAPQTDPLTETERKVATLAVRGHTNRQISKKLFITVSTVEQHLTRIYRKLNVTGRATLAQLLTDEMGRLRGVDGCQAG